MVRVCHLTSAHTRSDVRIFWKECIALREKGYSVTLIIADGLGDDVVSGVRILDVGHVNGRLNRMFYSVNKVLEKALSTTSDVYHIHDPELLRGVHRLLSSGKQVVYDMHEDLPRQILAKHWIPSILRKSISLIAEWYENRIIRKICGVITATKLIEKRVAVLNANTATVCNYPLLSEFKPLTVGNKEKVKNTLCYVGSIASIRGIKEMILALEDERLRGVKLILGGYFAPEALHKEMSELKGWSRVEFRGFQSREGVVQIFAESNVGLVLLHPTINYIDALPVKMFEYMAAGLPVLASNFPILKKIVEGNNCGTVVDPLDIKSISDSIVNLLGDSAGLNRMGINGIAAVHNEYNWESESVKLIKFYSNL